MPGPAPIGYDDPSQDPAVRQRVRQKLQGGTLTNSAPDTSGINDLPGLYRATGAGPVPAPPAPFQGPQEPMIPQPPLIGPGRVPLPTAPATGPMYAPPPTVVHNPRIAPTVPVNQPIFNQAHASGFNAFDPSADAPGAERPEPAQPTNPAQSGPTSGGGLPPGAVVNPDGSMRLADGTYLPTPPPGYTRNPTTGIVTYNGYNPTSGQVTGTPGMTTGTAPSVVPSGNFQAVFDQLFPGETLTPQMLSDQESALARYGIKVSRNAQGQATKVILPGGDIYDPIQGAGSGLNRKQWLLVGGPNFQGGAGGAGSASATSPFLDQIRQQLLARLGRDTAPVNESDNYIADPLNAARLEGQRGLDQERKQLAEEAFASSGGGPIDRNALSMQGQQATERMGTNLSTLRAGLIAKEYQARRADLNEAMQQALASGDAELARQVQLAISQLDATVRRESIGATLAMDAASRNAQTVAAGQHG